MIRCRKMAGAKKITSPNFRSLEADKIVDTIAQLERRIRERFPDAGLSKVAGGLYELSQAAVVRAEQIRRPNVGLRLLTGIVVVAVGALLVRLVAGLRWSNELVELEHFVQSLEALLGSVAFIGAAIVFLVSLELRIQRRRALQAVHELRVLAHIVDMHQLTKDPEGVTGRGPATESSPKRTMTPFELGRYLDYCSELLSLVSKIGALYVQEFPDSVALEAVDRLATLTNGLARNIWQKIMIIENIAGQRPEVQRLNVNSATSGR
jgi:hypothetical protein